RTILRYARPHRFRLMLLFALSALSAGLAALQPWPLKLVADHVLDRQPLPAALQSIFRTFSIAPTPSTVLAIAALGGLLLLAATSLLDAVVTWGWTYAGRRMVYDLAQDLFARLQRRSL